MEVTSSSTVEAAKTLDEVSFGGTAVSSNCRGLAAQKNRPAADKLFLDALANRHRGHSVVLDAGKRMREFSGRLCTEAGAARNACRGLDPPELKRYVNGTFEGGVGGDLGRRGYKAPSMNPSLKLGVRKVMPGVPLGPDMRRCIRRVRYATIPQETDVPDERLPDPKNAAFVAEAEVRVPDGTAVPPGAVFTIGPGTQVDQDVVMTPGKKCTAVRQTLLRHQSKSCGYFASKSAQ